MRAVAATRSRSSRSSRSRIERRPPPCGEREVARDVDPDEDDGSRPRGVVAAHPVPWRRDPHRRAPGRLASAGSVVPAGSPETAAIAGSLPEAGAVVAPWPPRPPRDRPARPGQRPAPRARGRPRPSSAGVEGGDEVHRGRHGGPHRGEPVAPGPHRVRSSSTRASSPRILERHRARCAYVRAIPGPAAGEPGEPGGQRRVGDAALGQDRLDVPHADRAEPDARAARADRRAARRSSSSAQRMIVTPTGGSSRVLSRAPWASSFMRWAASTMATRAPPSSGMQRQLADRGHARRAASRASGAADDDLTARSLRGEASGGPGGRRARRSRQPRQARQGRAAGPGRRRAARPPGRARASSCRRPPGR